MISSLPLLFLINQAQPLPKRLTPASANFSLKASKLPKVDLMSSASLPDRFAAGLWAHDFPEEGMIRVAAAVVANGHANVFRHGAEIADQVLDRFGGELRFAFEGFVEVRDVSLVMFVVMDFHRAARRCAVRARRWRKEVSVIRMP